MTILTTPRLILRPLTLDDLPDKHAMEQHPEWYEFQGFVRLPDGSKRPRTLAESRRMLEWRIAEFTNQGFGQWAVTSSDTVQFLGWAGLQYYLLDHGSYATPEIEMFYGLARQHWGRGIITEASGELLRFGFTTLKLRRITSCANRGNLHSINVMRRVGMRIEDHPGEPESVLGIIDRPTALERDV